MAENPAREGRILEGRILEGRGHFVAVSVWDGGERVWKWHGGGAIGLVG